MTPIASAHMGLLDFTTINTLDSHLPQLTLVTLLLQFSNMTISSSRNKVRIAMLRDALPALLAIILCIKITVDNGVAARCSSDRPFTQLSNFFITKSECRAG